MAGIWRGVGWGWGGGGGVGRGGAGLGVGGGGAGGQFVEDYRVPAAELRPPPTWKDHPGWAQVHGKARAF